MITPLDAKPNAAPRMPNQYSKRTARVYLTAILLLMVAGVAVRIVGALLLSTNYSMDHAVPCLMTKHISEGTAFPVFYYGQPYMGALESYAGALIYGLPFNKNLLCNLGTSLFGMLMLPLIWCWGRRAGGLGTGLAAVSLLMIGPPGYMQFMSWSYGGYAALTFFVSLLIFLAARLIERETSGESDSPAFGSWAMMGLIAGLGWWTGPLMMPALLTAALLLIICLRWRLLLRGGCIALPGFLLGSLPFWLWNVRHDFATFSFLRSGGSGAYGEGLLRYLRGMMEAWMSSNDARWASLALFLWIVLFLLTFFRKSKDGSTDSPNPALIYRRASWLLLVAALLLFADKPDRIGPGRYFLPFLPAMAVLMACAITTLNRYTRNLGGSLLLVAIILFQLTFLPVMMSWHKAQKNTFKEWNDIGRCIQNTGVSEVYARYADRTRGYGLNFYFDERYCLAELPETERQRRYAQRLELSECPGVLNDFEHIRDFLNSSGGSAEDTLCVDKFLLTHAFRPPEYAGTMLTKGYRIIEEKSGRDITEDLRANFSGKYWLGTRRTGGKIWRIEFDEPQRVTKLRFLLGSRHRPSVIRVEGLNVGSQDWAPLRDFILVTPWFWSGERPYPGGVFQRLDVSLSNKPLDGLRILLDEKEPDGHALVEGLHLYVGNKEERTPRTGAAFKKVIAFLQQRGIHRVFADRWEANQCYLHGSDDMRITLDKRLFKDDSRYLEPLLESGMPATALVVDSDDADAIREVLQSAGAAVKEALVAGWTVFELCAGTAGVRIDVPLIFRGCALGMREMPGQTKQPDWLAEALADSEGMHTLDLAFSNGLELKALYMKDTQTVAGGVLPCVWFWQMPPDYEPTDWAVFLHVKDSEKRTCFQSDRLLCEDYAQAVPMENGLVAERVMLCIPDAIAPGTYGVRFGLYDVNPPHERCRTAGFRRRLSVDAPFALEILPAEKGIGEKKP